MTQAVQNQPAIQQEIQPLPTATRDETDVKNFDDNMKNLLRLAMKIHDTAHGGMSNSMLWMVRVQKFLTAYTKAKNPPGFMDMWTKFYDTYTTELDQQIFAETEEGTTVNDKWLKDTTDKEKKSDVKTSGWNPRQLSCRGIVAYINPEVKSVSIPLTDIYLDAGKLSREKGSKNIEIYSYPASILFHMYSILNACVPGKPTLIKNVKILKTFLDEITTTEGTNDSVGEGIAGFSKIISSVMKQIGIDVPIDDKKLQDTVRDTLNSDTAKSVGKVVGKIIENVSSSTSGPDTLQKVMDGIGDACKDPNIRNMMGGNSTINPSVPVSRTSMIDEMDMAQGTVETQTNLPNISIHLPLVSDNGTPSSQE